MTIQSQELAKAFDAGWKAYRQEQVSQSENYVPTVGELAVQWRAGWDAAVLAERLVEKNTNSSGEGTCLFGTQNVDGSVDVSSERGPMLADFIHPCADFGVCLELLGGHVLRDLHEDDGFGGRSVTLDGEIAADGGRERSGDRQRLSHGAPCGICAELLTMSDERFFVVGLISGRVVEVRRISP